MNKTELIAELSDKTSVDKHTVERIINAGIETVMTEVLRGEAVQLIGFGTFSLADAKERKGTNPRTGEVITIPAHKRPAFKAGRAFKEMVNM